MSDRSTPPEPGVSSYLAMERAHYATLVSRSHFDTEDFTASNRIEQVVGFYAAHEAFDYERWLLGGLRRKPGAVALEYGCGPGRMIRRMSRYFDRVDGVDISPDVIAVAKRRCADLPAPPRLWVTSGDSVPEDARAFDFAYSVICLQHICVHSVRSRILETLFRALKPGGVLSFQMGYGPGHPNMVDYEVDFVKAVATNGVVDVGVLHPGELAADLNRIGFTNLAFALTPTGPGDKHGAWIFVRAVKPGTSALIDHTEVVNSAPYGFFPLLVDDGAVAQTRQTQRVHGVLGRRRNLHRRSLELERQIAAVQRERDEWRARAQTPNAA